MHGIASAKLWSRVGIVTKNKDMLIARNYLIRRSSQACVPLIKSLSNSSMRPRHWKMMVRTLGAQHTIVPDKFQEASLKELIDLGLLSKLIVMYSFSFLSSGGKP